MAMNPAADRLRNPRAYAPRQTMPSTPDEWEQKLTRKVMGYIRAGDVGEEQRRRNDRLGARIFYGQHWDRAMPSDRAAIMANLAMSIVRHKVAIMTKQDPIPIIEPDDTGDARAAQLMAKVIRRLWMSSRMREKSRRLATLANATRTAALKVSWDPVLRGGAGDIATDVIAGWNLILDNRVGDPAMMEFCGNRATMNKSRAMLYYPDAADKIRTLVDFYQTRKKAPLNGGGTPIPTPWKTSYIPQPGATIVNGKPVVTAFAGEMVSNDPQSEDVEIIELYHRDHTLRRQEVPVRDAMGRVKQEMVRDDDGIPQFTEGEPEMHPMPDGSMIALPRFELQMTDVTEEQFVRKYPQWRRTTICLAGGDGVLLEDRAWDWRLPYAFYTDIEPLDGMLGRGSILQVETLQALVNVGLSTMTDKLRYGALCAWLAGTSSGITSQVIIPGIGQVVPVSDVTALKPIEMGPLDPQFFTLLDRAVSIMERVLGATGIMQGESTGRLDSGAAYDTLAEIGGSTLVECTQRLETTISDWAEICGQFAQEFYDERHAIAVEDNEGQMTWQRVSSPLLQGSFSYTVATGSTMAWSESSKQQRAMAEYTSGLIDRQSYYEDTKKANWRQILERIEKATGPQGALGPAASPPPRTRQTANKSGKPPKPPAPHG
jgi:hypothetical protein